MAKFNSLHTPPGIVVKAEKKVPFSVSNITDIEVYRRERHEFEMAWEKKYVEKLALTRMLVHDLVAEQSKSLTFSQYENAEIEYRKTRDDDYTFKPRQIAAPGTWDAANKQIAALAVKPKPKRSHRPIHQMISDIVVKLMKSGFGW